MLLEEIHEIDKIRDEDSPEAMIAGVMAEKEDSSARGQNFDKKISEGLSSSQRKKILQALLEYDDRFARKGDKLGKFTAAEHTIETGDAKSHSTSAERQSMERASNS